MAKWLKVLQLIVLLANCSKQKGVDNSYSTKNAVDVNQTGMSFVFEDYQPATEQECPHGGWKIVKGRKPGSIEARVNLTPNLVSCLEIPVGQNQIIVTTNEPNSHQDDVASFWSEISYVQMGESQPFDGYYSDLCSSSETKGPAIQIRHLSAHFKIDCHAFSLAVEKMFRNQSLDLTPIEGVPEPVSIELFSPILDQVESLTFHYGSVNIDSGMEKLSKLFSLKIVGGPREVGYWNKIPPTVRKMQISDSDLATLAGIERASFVDDLRLANNKLEDIDALKFLHNLKHLDLSNNQIHRVDSLKTLEFLERVILAGNPLTNYTAVIEMLYARPNLRLVSDIDSIPRKAFFR